MKSNPSEPIVSPRSKTQKETKTRRVPPYHVVLLNDDYHSFEFVIGVVQQVFGFPLEKAFQLTKEAHDTGRSVVWTGPKEVAELKVEQVQTFHEKRNGRKDLGPLDCQIEPAPGA